MRRFRHPPYLTFALAPVKQPSYPSGMNQKTRMVNVRMTEADYERVVKAAEKGGHSSVSEWLRAIVKQMLDRAKKGR
jgi:hypothetical protein